MLQRNVMMLGALSCLGLASTVQGAETTAAPARLSAEQIAAKNVAARGGPGAWKAVQSLTWSGKLDVGSADSTTRSAQYVANSGKSARKKAKALVESHGMTRDTNAPADKQVQLPFTLSMERPHKMHLELEFSGKTALQVYDGANGWKVRPFLNRMEVEPFTPEEAKAEASEDGLDGPLIGYAAQGTKVAFEAVEKVEGHDAYRLKVTKKNGNVRHVWIDAQTFLDVKVEGTQRRMDGRMRDVWVYQRDFRSEQGLMIPHLIETSVDGYRETHKLLIDKVTVNPTLDQAMFSKPAIRSDANAAVVRKG